MQPRLYGHRLSDPWRRRVAVLAGGIVGSSLRVGLERAWETPPDAWPWATFLVNMVGAFVLGLLLPRLLAATYASASSLRAPLVAAGVLGSLTTFSLFVYEVWLLADHDRLVLAAVYAAVTVGVGFALALLGNALSTRGLTHEEVES